MSILNYDFVISALTFTIVMVLFNVVKDYVILPNFNISDTQKKNINKRWYLSFIIGIVILLFVYGCTGEVEECNKGEPSTGVICTEVYQPVRAPNGTIYPNSCYAEADGWPNECIILEPIYD